MLILSYLFPVGRRHARQHQSILTRKRDRGPNWIHGTENNGIFEIAKQTKTQLHSWEEKQQLFDTDGTPLSPVEAAEYGALLWDDGLIASAFRYSRQHTASIPASTSLLDYFRSEAAKLFADLPPQEADRKRATLLHICEFWGAYVGSPVSRQSLKFFWLEECIEGENPFVAETYHKILAHVAKPALDKADIRYENKVVEITCRGEGEEKPKITVEGKGTEEFDEIVVTTPLGWLKRNKGAFKPGLTKEMEKAIDSLGYGSLDKVHICFLLLFLNRLYPESVADSLPAQVYITFPSAFWEQSSEDTKPSTSATPSTSTDAAHTTPNLTATTHPLHQPCPTTAPTCSYPGFTHWISPAYSPLNPSRWDQEAMNLAALPQPSAHPTLLFYIYGPCASHIGHLVSTAPSPAALQTALTDFFHPYISRLPNYDADAAACVPRAALATNWVSDELAGFGSYCNFQVGLEDGDGSIRALRTGMPARGVWFAGEHTADFVALGTSTGAWGSGQGVAERIVRKIVGGDGEA